jgi:hypothetical protein
MIQRIQSIYLTLVLLLTLLLFRGSIFNFTDESGKAKNLMLNGNLSDQAGQSFLQIVNIWPLTVILILLASFSLITLLLFKYRKIQLFLALSVVVMAAGLTIALSCYAFIAINNFNLSIMPGFKIPIPVLILIFSILAYRGILKDDRLVKSYDRLR